MGFDRVLSDRGGVIGLRGFPHFRQKEGERMGTELLVWINDMSANGCAPGECFDRLTRRFGQISVDSLRESYTSLSNLANSPAGTGRLK